MPKRKIVNMKEATKHLIALTEEKEQIFYNALEEGKTITEACNIVGIKHGTFTNHGIRKPTFAIKCRKIISRKKIEKVKNKPKRIIIKEKKPLGRPTLMTPETLEKLELAFCQGFTDLQACIFANISRDVFYDYIKRNPSFGDRKEELKKMIDIEAKIKLVEAIKNGDMASVKFWLERKCKDEFSLKTETEHSGQIQSKVVYIEKEEKEAYEKHINKIIEDAD